MRTFVTIALVVGTACWRAAPGSPGVARPVANGDYCGNVGHRIAIPMNTPFRYYESIERPTFFVARELELGTPTGAVGCTVAVYAIDDACHGTMTCDGRGADALFPLTFVHDKGVLHVTSASTHQTWIARMSPKLAYGCMTLGEQHSKTPMALCFDMFGGLDISVPGAIYTSPPTRTPGTPAL